MPTRLVLVKSVMDLEKYKNKALLLCFTDENELFNKCNTFICLPLSGSFTEEVYESMSGPSSMVGVRIPDDELALLDQHVGVDGMRSRSDVIRRGLRRLFEAQPTLPSMKSVTIELGTAQQFQLAHLLEMKGQTPEMAINEALNSYLSQVVEDLAALNERFESTANEIRERVTRSKEFGQ